MILDMMKKITISCVVLVVFLGIWTEVKGSTTVAPTPIPGGVQFCKTKGCQYDATTCVTLNNDPSEALVSCACTPGFTGKTCGQNMLSTYQAQVNAFNPDVADVTFNDVNNITEKCMEALEDQMSKNYVGLTESVTYIAEIQLRSIGVLQNDKVKIKKDDNLLSMVMYYGNFTHYVFQLTQQLYCANCTLTMEKSESAILLSEVSLIDTYKFYLKNKKVNNLNEIEDFTMGIISSAIMKDKGKNLPEIFVARFGEFKLPFWETFQDEYKNKDVSVIVLTYSSSPYFFANNTDAINAGIVMIITLDEKMEPITLPDPTDPVNVNADASSAIAATQKWLDMDREDEPPGTYTARIGFNESIVAVIVDVKYVTKKRCSTWGKFGKVKPTEDNFDILVNTKGLSRVEKYRPDDLSHSFKSQILQFSINFVGDESLTKPLILIIKCEDDVLVSRRRRSASPATPKLPQFRIAKIDLRHFNNDTKKWEKSDNIKVTAGQGSNVAFKSNFFGTFSADVLFIPPDPIDFNAIFLDFAGKLQENPYGLSTIAGLWLLFILVVIPLRRLDKGDAEMWNYAPLKDNDPMARFRYYLAVSTAIRSARNFTSTVFFDLIGDKNHTGPRILSDGYRQNFIRGTTSHFYMTTSMDLGNLRTLKVWHDNTGKNPRWLLSKVIVGDIRSKKRYVFTCGEWLSLDSEDGRVNRKLSALDEKVVDNSMVFSDLSKRHLFDDHLWFSVSKRPNFSKFTRVQRIWSVAALLFLSMMVSAMFFNTNEKQGRAITLGPLTFTYKQFYVAFLSAAMALFPSLVIISIFKYRRIRGEDPSSNDKENVRRKRCCPNGLPWWFIFFGYGLIASCILSCSFFLFMYSLDWGSAITLEWMLSIVIGLLMTIFILEPMKAVVLAMMLTCCCSRSAQRSIATLPEPPENNDQEDIYYVESTTKELPSYAEYPDDENETEAQKLYKERLILDRRLTSKIKSWLLQISYLILICILCNHDLKYRVYNQNAHLKGMMNSTYIANSTEDIFAYIEDHFIPTVFSQFFENGDTKMVYDRLFIGDDYHYRLGLSRIRQVRAQGSCSIASQMRGVVDICSLAYTKSSENIQDYCPEWNDFNDTEGGCFDENEETHYAFLYKSEFETKALDYRGIYGNYKGGGYLIDIGPKASLALEYVQFLRSKNWIDISTRAVFIESMLFNVHSRLFSHIKVVFEQAFFGGFIMTTNVYTSNLYPYGEAWDFIVLGLQLLFLVILLVRLILVCIKVVKTRCRYFMSYFGIARVLEIGLGIAAAVFYIMRIDQTIAAIEKIFKDIGLFVPFEMVNIMDLYYSYCLGFLCFIVIIDLLKPLSFNFYLHLMKTAILSSRGKLLAFVILLVCIVMGYASLLFLIYGNTESEFKDIPTALLSLFRVMIGMVNFRQQMHIDDLGVILIFGLYCLMVTVVIMNLFISSLNMALSDSNLKVRLRGKHKFDEALNEHLWWKIANLLGIKDRVKESNPEQSSSSPDCREFDNLETSPPPTGGVEMEKLRQKLRDEYKDDYVGEKDVLKTCLFISKQMVESHKLRCISRTTKDGTQYLYLNQDTEFTLMLQFHSEMTTQILPAKIMSAKKLLVEHFSDCDTISALSWLFTVDDDDEVFIQENGPVDIKIVSRSFLPSSQTIYLLTTSDNGQTWEQTAATTPKPGNPCICAAFEACPRQFLAIVSDTMLNVPKAVSDKSEYHTITPGGDMIHMLQDKRISVRFDPDTVSSATKVVLAIEPCFPSTILYILSLDDILNKPISITFPQTAFVPKTEFGESPEFLALRKVGILRKWQKVNTSVQRSNQTFKFKITGLKRGVQMAVHVKASEIQDPILYLESNQENLYVLIRKICNSTQAASRWDIIGKKLNVSPKVIESLKTDKPQCCEDKCSIVISNWCKTEREPTFQKLQKCIDDLQIDVS